jgi:hypothetical protein
MPSPDELGRNLSAEYFGGVEASGHMFNVVWYALEGDEARCCAGLKATSTFVVNGSELSTVHFAADSPDIVAHRIAQSIVSGDRSTVDTKISLSLWTQVMSTVQSVTLDGLHPAAPVSVFMRSTFTRVGAGLRRCRRRRARRRDAVRQLRDR